MRPDMTVAEFFNQPIVVTLIGVLATATLALIGALLRLLNKLAKMDGKIDYITQELVKIETDPDVMRWSNYGRATAAFQMVPQPGGPQQ